MLIASTLEESASSCTERRGERKKRSNIPEHAVVKWRDFLDSNLLSRRLVHSRADNTICALADDILDVILLADVEGDLAGTALRRSARHGCVMCEVFLFCGEESESQREMWWICVYVFKKSRVVAQQLGEFGVCGDRRKERWRARGVRNQVRGGCVEVILWVSGS
jgi:hypothetical protein